MEPEVFTYDGGDGALCFQRTDVPNDGACLYHCWNRVLEDRASRFGLPWAHGRCAAAWAAYVSDDRLQFLRDLCADYVAFHARSIDARTTCLAAHDLLDVSGSPTALGTQVLATGLADYVRRPTTWGTNYELGGLRTAFDLDVVVFAGDKGVEALRPAVRGGDVDVQHPLVRFRPPPPARRRRASTARRAPTCYCVLLYSNAQHYSLLSFVGSGGQLAYDQDAERDATRHRALFHRAPLPLRTAPRLARTATAAPAAPRPLKRTRTVHQIIQRDRK